ncbi:MAG: DUF2244 domain-containing protein [Ideonella sp.]|jgi:uncharacterized membrane protein|nr:DUF2244 domain-containing protein [Ideonella sp.]
MSSALPTLAAPAGLLPSAGESSTAAPARNWCLQRNCSTTPSVLVSLYGVLVVVSLGIAVFFWSQGATLVLPFALLEVGAVGIALVVYARHAIDGERLHLEPGRLVVQRRRGTHEERFEFHAQWVRVSAAPGGAIDLHEGRRSLRVGTCATASRRAQALREINEALAQLRRGAAAGRES